jgi:hypothetical protein
MSQPVALFVSEERLKAFTSVNQNVSPLDLMPYILQAQDIELQYMIGSTFYFQLRDQVLSGTVSVANQFLLDNYIGSMLCNYGLERALPFLKYKVFNKSVLSPTSENAETITLEELKFLQQEVRSTAQVYGKRCIEWIINHPADYPTYFSSNVLDGQMPAGDGPFRGGLVIPAQGYAWQKRAFGSRYFGGFAADPYFCPNGGVSSPIVQQGIQPG